MHPARKHNILKLLRLEDHNDPTISGPAKERLACIPVEDVYKAMGLECPWRKERDEFVEAIRGISDPTDQNPA